MLPKLDLKRAKLNKSELIMNTRDIENSSVEG